MDLTKLLYCWVNIHPTLSPASLPWTDLFPERIFLFALVFKSIKGDSEVLEKRFTNPNCRATKSTACRWIEKMRAWRWVEYFHNIFTLICLVSENHSKISISFSYQRLYPVKIVLGIISSRSSCLSCRYCCDARTHKRILNLLSDSIDWCGQGRKSKCEKELIPFVIRHTSPSLSGIFVSFLFSACCAKIEMGETFFYISCVSGISWSGVSICVWSEAATWKSKASKRCQPQNRIKSNENHRSCFSSGFCHRRSYKDGIFRYVLCLRCVWPIRAAIRIIDQKEKGLFCLATVTIHTTQHESFHVVRRL